MIAPSHAGWSPPEAARGSLGRAGCLALLVAVAAPAAACAGRERATFRAGGGITVWGGREHGVSEGRIDVALSPSQVYALVEDVQRWPAIFPSVRSARVTAEHGGEQEVELVSKGGDKSRMVLRHEPSSRRVRFSERHGRVEVDGVIEVGAAPRGQGSRVRARIRAEVHGIARWFVGDGELQRRREQRLSRDLGHLRDYLRARTAARR